MTIYLKYKKEYPCGTLFLSGTKNKKAVLLKYGFPVLICPLQFSFWFYINLCGALCRCTAQINIEKNYDIDQLSKLRSPLAMK